MRTIESVICSSDASGPSVCDLDVRGKLRDIFLAERMADELDGSWDHW
jgi:hypothetical protein